MEKDIVKDTVFLSQPSLMATRADREVIQDLKDTLKAHPDCLGMAANMIGVSKRIIIVRVGKKEMIMVNPMITKKTFPFEARESCLSLDGWRTTTRYQEIEVQYQDDKFRKKKTRVKGLIAQIIQHETDHLEGILI